MTSSVREDLCLQTIYGTITALLSDVSSDDDTQMYLTEDKEEVLSLYVNTRARVFTDIRSRDEKHDPIHFYKKGFIFLSFS